VHAASQEVVYVVGHKHPDTDSIGSAIAYARLKQLLGEPHVHAARAGELNAETRYVLERFSVPPPELLERGTGRRLILVDHNEVAQALDDVRHATILEVWEHHRVGDLDVPEPIVFHCEPVGATATLIAEQYFLHEVEPPPDIAALLLAAILSDTLVFASPTCSGKDREMARRLGAIAGVDAAALGRDLIPRATPT
jgi:manganese-dependent inorganic pyrophosphatase